MYPIVLNNGVFNLKYVHEYAVDNSIHRKNVAPKSHLTRISPVASGKFVITSRIGHPILDEYATPYANANPYRRMWNVVMKEPYVRESVLGMAGSILSILDNLLLYKCMLIVLFKMCYLWLHYTSNVVYKEIFCSGTNMNSILIVFY